MDLLLSSYAQEEESSSPLHRLPSKSAAPAVNDDGTAPAASSASMRPVAFNLMTAADQLWAPIHAPNRVDNAPLLPSLFDGQYYDACFHRFDAGGATVLALSEHKRRHLLAKEKGLATSPWCAGEKEAPPPAELSDQQKRYAEAHAAKNAEKDARRRGQSNKGDDGTAMMSSTVFHGKEERDYQGRPWTAPPTHAAKPAATGHRCYLQKRRVHEWAAHSRGVSAIRFFPTRGHLLLSAGMDATVKIWDVADLSSRAAPCMRTYTGHSKAVKDISFSSDGSRFLSAGLDGRVRLWDTETGQAVATFSTGKVVVPHVARLHPDGDKQHAVLAGMGDGKVVQWDARSSGSNSKATLEYGGHMGAVNTVTFVDGDRRFVTSSDDASLRVWEFGVPVEVKRVSAPEMHAVPAVALHPGGGWLAAQSLDDRVLVYSAKERDGLKLNSNKSFAGHSVAGYACQVSFSPDGRFLMSGDGEGNCWFWDWKTCRRIRRFKCHAGVCIGCEWHPVETIKVATCGWDGVITYWD